MHVWKIRRNVIQFLPPVAWRGKKGLRMRNEAVRALWTASLLIGPALLSPSTVRARAGPRWEVEFHGGVGAAGSSIKGEGAVPAPAVTFCCSVINGPFRPVSSWYFGDGA